ncbi:MAG TPA: MASE1 domain-containing protein, partial [Mycobacterium sp.]|nr:MASE1 domain-containing protein [Mycobacterium sp.]
MHKARSEPLTVTHARGAARFAVELLVVGLAYFILAKVGQGLTAIGATATPVWPATGLGLAAVLLCGLRVWPAIFVAAFAATATTEVANATLEGTLLAASGVATGYALEAVVGGYLAAIWSGGVRTFDTSTGVLKFALIGLAPGTALSAGIGTASLSLAGYVEWSDFPAIGFAWWLGDVAGALVITPVIVLWARRDWRGLAPGEVLEAGVVLLLAAAVGFVLFDPPIEAAAIRSSLGFLAILPLLWATLRCDPAVTTTAALILACFAVAAAVTGGRPIAEAPPEASFLLLVLFMIGIAVPSLAVSADIAARKRREGSLRQREQDLRAMFSQAVIGMAQIDPAGRLLLVNGRFCEIVQRSSAELMRLRLQEITDPDDLP